MKGQIPRKIIGLVAGISVAAVFAIILVMSNAPDGEPLDAGSAEQVADLRNATHELIEGYDPDDPSPTYAMDDPYLGLLGQNPFHPDTPAGRPGEHDTAYEREIQRLYDAADRLELEYQIADRAGDPDATRFVGSAMYAVEKNLETYGVAGADEVRKNSGYWERRTAVVRDWINGQTGPDVSIRDLIIEVDLGRISPTIDVEDPYLELLKQDDFYLEMTPDEQEAYVQTISESRANHTAYERVIWRLFDARSLLELEYQAADRAGDQERMELIDSEIYAVEKTLETYGVAGQLEEVQKNHSYWESLMTEVRDRINKAD